MRSDQIEASFLVESGHGALRRSESGRPGTADGAALLRPRVPLAPPPDVEPEPSNKKPVRNWPQAAALLLGGYALVGGLISFTGWLADIQALTDWQGIGVSIQPLATVASILAGGAAILLALEFPRVAGSLGVLVSLIGLSAIVQTAASLDLGLDTLLMFGREWGRVGVTSPGRMGVPGSVSWTIIGAALLFASIGQQSRDLSRSRLANDMAVPLAVIGLGVSTLSLIGFLHSAEALYTLPRLTVIAVQTSSFIFATSLAILFSLRTAGPMPFLSDPGPGGTLIRRLLPAVVLIPIALGLLVLTGVNAGLYDIAFGVAIRTLLEIGLMLALLVWTARAVSRQARITEEKQRDLTLLADAMPQVVWIADPDGKVTYYNAQIAGFGGIEHDAERPDNWKPAMHADDADGAAKSWADALATSRPYAHEHRIQMADGSYRWHLSRAFPVLAPAGTAEKWYGTTTDIHDLKLAEEVLRESEQRFARFMHHLPGLAWIKDPAGRYVYANDAAMRAFKMSKALFGRTDAEVFPPETAAAFSFNDKKALENAAGVQVIEQLQDENGVVRHSLVTKFPISLSPGSEPMIGGMAIDITEQKQTEADREFLFGITEQIRIAEEPEELLADISTAVGEYLGVHRCLFNSIDLATDLETVHSDYSREGTSVAGRHKISEYSSITSDEMRRGITVVNNDAALDERTADVYDRVYGPNKERSYVAVPMLRDGVWVASLWCSDDRPRKWADHEIELLENIAERTWVAVERLRVNALLRESAERFRLAQEAGNVGIWDWDVKNSRTYWSEQMWHLYDEQPDAADPNIDFWVEHLHPDDAATALARFHESVRSADRHRDTFRVLRKTGEVRWIESFATVVRDLHGQPIRMYGVNLDITATREIAEALRQAHDELEDRVARRTQQLAALNEQLKKQMDERTQIEEQRVRLLKKLFTIQEDERGRIARDIHDQLGQRLTALRLKIAAVRDLCPPDQLVFQRVTRLQEISELLDSEVSFLAWELRPSILNETDLDSALDQYVREWSRFSGIFAECDRSGLQGVRVDSEIATNLYRITQEALNNVAKYSQAEVVNVLLEKRGSDLILIIEDNGVGFDVGSVEENGEGHGGFGLVGMRERASLISGTFEIESAAGQGTTIFVRVPMGDIGGDGDGS